MFGLQKALGSYFEGQERKKKEKIKRKEKEGTHTQINKPLKSGVAQKVGAMHCMPQIRMLKLSL